MLNKLEELYLTILRYAVIISAGILLIAAIIYGLSSFKILSSEPKHKDFIPKVSENTMIESIAKKNESKATLPEKEMNKTKKTDPNQEHYDKIATVVTAFVSEHCGGTQNVNRDDVIRVTRNKAEAYNNPKRTSAYAKNFAETITKTLADPTVINKAKSGQTCIDLINTALGAFQQEFDTQIRTNNEEHNRKTQEYMIKKSEGLTNLYFALGAFGTFLSIVFLSVIIKIERNLRSMRDIVAAGKITGENTPPCS